MSRIPTRLRLTLVFATTTLLVLAVTGVFVYEQFRSQLDLTINSNLSTQATTLIPLLEASDSGLDQAVASPLISGHETVVQLLDRNGRILAATPGLRTSALLGGEPLKDALKRSLLLTQDPIRQLPEGARLLTTPIRTPRHGSDVLIIAATLDERASALSNLALLLVIVGPLALIVASLAAYWLASAALKPVELMRRRAAAVTASEPGVRLPLPLADDEIRRLGKTLNEMLARLEESFAREQVFVANASHELRTPLATLKTELELALRRERSPEELRQALRSAESEVDRLSALADDLLVLARAGDGHLPIRRAKIAVDELLETVQGRFGSSATRIRIAAPVDMHVLADPQRLEQALGNLIDNALRYSVGKVTLTASASQAATEIHVTDEGPGFRAGFADQAFERFARADPGRGGRGAGLGLSIVRVIAHAHGGEAYLANRPVGGADVWIVIPPAPDPVR